MGKKGVSTAEMDRIRNEYTRLVKEGMLSQKEAAQKVGVTLSTACRWYAELMDAESVTRAGINGNGSYSAAEMMLLKEQLLIAIVKGGTTQKEAARRVGIAQKTASAWVKQLGGMAGLRKRYEQGYKWFAIPASEYITYLQNNDKYRHMHQELVSGYADFMKSQTK